MGKRVAISKEKHQSDFTISVYMLVWVAYEQHDDIEYKHWLVDIKIADVTHTSI